MKSKCCLPGTKPLAFTVLELLVAISIIIVLCTLSGLRMARVRASAKRLQCINNLHQLAIAVAAYSSDDLNACFTGALDDQDDDQNWLFPAYMANSKIFACPATRNTIRNSVYKWDARRSSNLLRDLNDNARGVTAPGSSYEVFGFMNYNGGSFTELSINGIPTNVPGVRKTASSVQNYRHRSNAQALREQIVGPSSIWLLLDGDDVSDNLPSSASNHGPSGSNVQFCDGHVEWITAKRWNLLYELSQDENRQ